MPLLQIGLQLLIILVSEYSTNYSSEYSINWIRNTLALLKITGKYTKEADATRCSQTKLTAYLLY